MQIYFTPWIHTPMRSTLTILHQLSKTEVKELYIVGSENVYVLFVCLYFQILFLHVIVFPLQRSLFFLPLVSAQIPELTKSTVLMRERSRVEKTIRAMQHTGAGGLQVNPASILLE